MPNIMFYGYPDSILVDVKHKVTEAVKGLYSASDIVLTIVESSTQNLRGGAVPYLRVSGTSLSEIDKIIDCFREAKIGENVKAELLVGFFRIPRAELTNEGSGSATKKRLQHLGRFLSKLDSFRNFKTKHLPVSVLINQFSKDLALAAIVKY